MRRVVLAAALVLAGCSPQAESPFTVSLSLSPAAASQLRETGEQVKLSATYYWRPEAGGPSHDENEYASVIGGYPMGHEEYRAAWNAGTVQLRGAHSIDDRVKRGRGAMRVLLNVTSARLKSPDNILGCDFHDDTLANASAGVSVTCELPSEKSPG